MSKHEDRILTAIKSLHSKNIRSFTGFQIAKELSILEHTKYLIPYGTLYGTLTKLVKKEILESVYETSAPMHRIYILKCAPISEAEKNG